MTDKDPKDMTASELLRKAAIRETDEYGNITPHVKMFSALAGEDAAMTDYVDRGGLMRQLADKIDAEIVKAYSEKLNTCAMRWAKANGWPDFREGEDFGAWLERCFLPRPRFEDGEPVQMGDEIAIGGGSIDVNEAVMLLDGSGYRLLHSTDVSASAIEDLVKRPAPEVLGADGKPIKVGETVWDVYGRGPAEVYRIGPTDGEDGPVVWDIEGNYTMPYLLTHERPVLGADGLPIKVGDRVWLDEEHFRYADSSGSEGGYEYSLCGIVRQEMLTVEDARHEVCGRDYIRVDMCSAWCHASWLTHTQPDTQERIYIDKRKTTQECWECRGSKCSDCPSEIDGEKPADHYGVLGCTQAQGMDIARRQAELDKRTGGAE